MLHKPNIAQGWKNSSYTHFTNWFVIALKNTMLIVYEVLQNLNQKMIQENATRGPNNLWKL